MRSPRLSPLRSVGARLALALALVVAIALGIVYAIVVPRLERNLVAAKIDALRLAAEPIVVTFPTDFVSTPLRELELASYLDDVAARTNARVTVFDWLAAEALSPIEDTGPRAAEVQNDPVAVEAAQRIDAAEGTVTRNGERFAEVAFPLSTRSNSVILFSSSLEDTLSNVRLVKRRVLLAAVPALLVAMLLGYGGASVFARRIRRLERAANRIAGGRLDEPVVDRGQDELGELARAFERMRRRLAQLDHARREFIANASHELRTPIFSLGGFLELLANEDLDERTRREFVTAMQEQVERLTKLATDLLDLSRLDAGQLRLESEPLDLASLAEVLASEFTGVAVATGHDVEVVSEGRAPEALADELRALQIGRVLLENAIRHTAPDTAVTVRAGTRGGWPVLEVEDRGPGIPPEHAGQVFERFFRVDGTRASGSGLGLAIARELAEAMGGTLELESEPGRTVFRLQLPAAPAAPAVREPASV